ncbi:mercury(II) reductase [Nocardia vermiculata]|uniref:Mercuric reductase n=1 Tax=Nocardia vermiculata TaxID=257274 RepID=A0A846YAX1_9NOCA|nr:mercury(II) reductase [Nocardia vermiculata]NKY53919.1 mercury(II) reductase [Nocardia vermiculata]
MTPTDSRADLAIIGSGSAAFAAAIAATNLGKRVVMVERGTVGGTCVNVGCVPSKALLAAAEARHSAAAAGRFPGLTAAAVPLDFPDLIAGKDALVTQLRAEKYLELAVGYGWEIVSGTAVFDGGTEKPVLRVELAEGGTRVIEADQYLIATGAAPWVPPIDGLAEAGYLTSTTAMDLHALPESLIVVGAGYVGLEQAQLFARLGSKVTVIARSRLTSGEEPEISAALEAVFADEHIDVHTATTVEKVLAADGHKLVTVRTRDGAATELRAEHVLIATGRRPNTAALGLESVGVTVDAHGAVLVDDCQRSSNPRIWAAGDVTGDPQFVYVAAAQGTLVADNAFAHADRALDYTTVPRVTFTSPAIASVGLTDTQAAAAGLACQCRVLDLAYVPRALVNRDTRGLVKIIAEQGTGAILGVHALTDNAGDLITAAGYAMTAGMTVQQLAHTWAPYLTMGEALKLTAQTFTTDVTKLSCCAG